MKKGSEVTNWRIQMKDTLETKIEKLDLDDLSFAYENFPNSDLVDEFFAYNISKEIFTPEYNLIINEIKYRSKDEPKRWVYQNFEGFGKHCLDVYLFSKKKELNPKSKNINPKIGVLKKAYYPELVKIPVKVQGKTYKMSPEGILEKNPKRIHAIYKNMYERGESLFEIIDGLNE